MGSRLSVATTLLTRRRFAATVWFAATLVASSSAIANDNATSDETTADRTSVREAASERNSASVHRDRGMVLYKNGEYAAAQSAFGRAYRLDPSTDILFAWAQAARLEGDCVTAAALYRSFIAATPPVHQIEAARQHIKACEDTITTAGPLGVSLAQNAEQCSNEAPRPLVHSNHSASSNVVRRSILSDPDTRLSPTLAVAGGVALAASAVSLAAGQYHANAARDANDYDAFAYSHDVATKWRIGGGVALGLGAALGIASVVSYVRTGRRRAYAATQQPSVAFSRSAVSIGWRGEF